MADFILLNLLSVIVAYLLDIRFGDPETKYHPICLMGQMINKLERIFYPFSDKFIGGVLLLVFTVGIATVLAYLVLSFAYGLSSVVYLVLNSVIIFFSISVTSMVRHAESVYEPLSEDSIEVAREELSKIVSRDTNGMGEEMLVRSTVESISENFTDGVVSPVFFSVFFGGVGAVFFKSVSTLDSMVGYMNERYEFFGRASAKADDVLNFVPARLSVLIITVAGFFRSTVVTETFRVAKKFRLSHPSPNSAHSMSAFAGVLGVKLGGPVSYFGKIKDKEYIGDGAGELKPEIIRESISLYKISSFMAIMSLAGIPLLRILL